MFLFHVEGAKIHSIECMCEILYKRSKQAMSKTSMILKQAIIDYIEFIYFLSKTSKILKQAITDYIQFILFHVEDIRDVYNVYKLQCIF